MPRGSVLVLFVHEHKVASITSSHFSHCRSFLQVSQLFTSPLLKACLFNMDKDLHSRVNITPSFPFELHYIKALYLNHQYKECARRCEDLLVHYQVIHLPSN